MSFILTLVSANIDYPLTDTRINTVIEIIRKYDVMPTCAPIWLQKDKAADIGISETGPREMMEDLQDHLAHLYIDVFIVPIENRRKKLLIADMDSTIVKEETLDELADYAGLKEQISEITQRAMDGELDFYDALRERVGLLRGLHTDALLQTLEKLELSPGAKVFIKTMRKSGAICVLVSGGFTFFTSAIAKELDFNNHHGNTIEIDGEELTGKIKMPLIDKEAKLRYLLDYMRQYDLKMEQCMAIGDGANDLLMLEQAGLGIGYRPKKAVIEAIDNVMLHGDLTAALFAQGFTADDFCYDK